MKSLLLLLLLLPLQGPLTQDLARKWATKYVSGDDAALEPLQKGGAKVVPWVRDLFTEDHKIRFNKLVTGICKDELDRSLREESGLQFRGQFAHLEVLGIDGARAMLEVFRDEDQFQRRRTRAGLAIGDICTTEEFRQQVLPALREIARDFLSELWLEREAAYLMARLGDRSHVDTLIASLLEVAKEKPTNANLGALLSAHQELSEVYYRITDYESAIRHYRQREVILVDLIERARKAVIPSIEAELALLRYNLSCSLSLAGRPEEARKLLEVALKHDDVTFDMVQIDGDLKGVRNLEDHEEWLAKQSQPAG